MSSFSFHSGLYNESAYIYLIHLTYSEINLVIDCETVLALRKMIFTGSALKTGTPRVVQKLANPAAFKVILKLGVYNSIGGKFHVQRLE